MRIHHDKHHQAYVDKANAALEGTEWADRPVEDVLANLSSLPADKQGPVRNNAGGHANHSLFWTVLGPNGGGAPTGEMPTRKNPSCCAASLMRADRLKRSFMRKIYLGCA